MRKPAGRGKRGVDRKVLAGQMHEVHLADEWWENIFRGNIHRKM